MPATVANITFDSDDALVVATFWSLALDRPLDSGGDAGFCSIGRFDPVRSQPAWFFEKVPEPKASKNRMHLDLLDADPDAVAHLVELGATFVADHEFGGGMHKWTVMQDPEGNEFCVAATAFAG